MDESRQELRGVGEIMSGMSKYLARTRGRLLSLKKAIKGYNDIIDSMERICHSSSGANCVGTHCTNTSDPTYQIVAKIETLREKRDDMILEYNALSEELIDLFDTLPHPLRVTMILHYVSGYSWERVAEKYEISPRGIYRRRDEAIKRLSGRS